MGLTEVRTAPVLRPEASEADYLETASGLKLLDETVGEGKEARPGDAVSVHYTGTLVPSGEKFDSSLEHGRPFTFHLGAGQVIAGDGDEPRRVTQKP